MFGGQLDFVAREAKSIASTKMKATMLEKFIYTDFYS